MDRKSIIVVVLCLLLLTIFSQVVNKLYPPIPLPAGATNTIAAAEGSLSTNAAVAPAATITAATTNAAPIPVPQLSVNTNVPEELIVVSNENARYTFSSHGGGLKLVELVKYPEAVATHRLKQPDTSRVATLNAQTPAPTLAVLDGAEVQGDGIFEMTRTATGVHAEKALSSGLKLIKDFSLGTNYLLTATVRLENRSGQALALPAQEWVVGMATPLSVQDYAVGTMWYNGSASQDQVGASYFSKSGFACTPRTPPSEYRRGQTNVVWAAVHNQFFALVLMPHDPAGEVVMRPVQMPPPTEDQLRDNPQLNPAPVGYEATLVYPAMTLAPGNSVERQFVLFAGPKEYRTLASLASRFNNDIDAIMGFGGFFGFFAKGLLLGMNLLHNVFSLPYGWSIIAITVIIKLIFWPLTQASTRSMKRMQLLQPQMAAIKEKYKDDPLKAQKKTMEFMKENKVSPMGGCLPLLLQMPVLFGFFYMIRSAIELRGAPFLWVADLARPDTLFVIPGLNLPFNLLPLLMAGTQVWQAHLTPPSPSMDPMQQKLMRYMPLIMVAIFYKMPAGLTLYYTVQSVLTIVQTKLTKTDPAAAAAPALTPPQKKKK